MPQFQRNPGERSRRLPRWLLAACVVAGLVAMLVYRTTRPVVDLDLWHEMALAREVVQLGYVPRADDFAYTPTVEPVVHHEWGAGIIAYGLANTLGASGILLLKLMLVAALAAACWTCARRRGVGLPLLSCLAPFAILLADDGFSTVRAQMYSFVGLALLLIFLDRDRAGHRRWLLAWLPLFVLWLNLHAGFLVGAGLFAVHWVEQLLRRQPHWHLLLTGLVMLGLIGNRGWVGSAPSGPFSRPKVSGVQNSGGTPKLAQRSAKLLANCSMKFGLVNMASSARPQSTPRLPRATGWCRSRREGFPCGADWCCAARSQSSGWEHPEHCGGLRDDLGGCQADSRLRRDRPTSEVESWEANRDRLQTNQVLGDFIAGRRPAR